MRFLAGRIGALAGRIVERFEVWTQRSNEERHGIGDPYEIMRRAAACQKIELNQLRARCLSRT